MVVGRQFVCICAMIIVGWQFVCIWLCSDCAMVVGWLAAFAVVHRVPTVTPIHPQTHPHPWGGRFGRFVSFCTWSLCLEHHLDGSSVWQPLFLNLPKWAIFWWNTDISFVPWSSLLSSKDMSKCDFPFIKHLNSTIRISTIKRMALTMPKRCCCLHPVSSEKVFVPLGGGTDKVEKVVIFHILYDVEKSTPL